MLELHSEELSQEVDEFLFIETSNIKDRVHRSSVLLLVNLRCSIIRVQSAPKF